MLAVMVVAYIFKLINSQPSLKGENMFSLKNTFLIIVVFALLGCQEELNIDVPTTSNLEVAPDAKQSIEVDANTQVDNRILVLWQPVKYASNGYRLRYRVTGSQSWQELDLTQTSYHIPAAANETYEVQIFALGRGGMVIDASPQSVTVSNRAAAGKDEA